MFTPPTENLFMMEMMDHMGPDSLDAIATRVYGRKYVGQQTGEMIGNDSHVLYDMSEDEVATWNADMEAEPRRHYIGYDRATMTPEYAEGVNWFEYWLRLDESKFDYDFEVYCQAPTPNYVLADLIRRGELPYGKYLMHVWW